MMPPSFCQKKISLIKSFNVSKKTTYYIYRLPKKKRPKRPKISGWKTRMYLRSLHIAKTSFFKSVLSPDVVPNLCVTAAKPNPVSKLLRLRLEIYTQGARGMAGLGCESAVLWKLRVSGISLVPLAVNVGTFEHAEPIRVSVKSPVSSFDPTSWLVG